MQCNFIIFHMELTLIQMIAPNRKSVITIAETPIMAFSHRENGYFFMVSSSPNGLVYDRMLMNNVFSISTMSTKHKILFVTRPLAPPWDEASKNFAYDLAVHATAGDITILTNAPVPGLPSHITQKRIYTANRFSLWQKIRLVWWLTRHAKHYDIAHLLFTPTPFNSAILRCILHRARLTVVQTIATVRDDLYTPRQLRALFFGDALVVYSQWGANKLRALEFTNVHHIYPGIDTARFRPAPKDPLLLQKWNIAPDATVVTYPGEFVRLGATDMIIDAFAQIWRNGANREIIYLCACRIKNAADAAKKRDVVERLTQLGIADRVRFTDTYNNMNAVYNLSDIIIFPVADMRGKFDVPLAMVEPYLCEKPVIASHLPQLAEFSSPAINVILPTLSANALAGAIVRLAHDPAARAHLGKNASTFARSTFTIPMIAHAYEDLYNKF